MRIITRTIRGVLVFGILVPRVGRQEENQEKAAPTRFQREATGFWRDAAFRKSGRRMGGDPAWRCENTMSITWPTGLGGSSFGAEIEGTRLVPIGDQVQIVVETRNARIGALSFAGRGTVSSKRTKEDPNDLCE
jgi:hypothetical protein